jgi:fibronectin type 3 domain-containing protein
MKRILALVLVVLLGVSVIYALPVRAADTIPISEARTKPVGTTVTVQGIVTAKPGTFNRGFAIQDDTGGIYVYPQDKFDFDLGDEVLVTGTIDNYNGQIEVKPQNKSDVKLVGHKAPIKPKQIKTGDVGPKNLGLLVQVSGKVVSKKTYYFYVDDGSGKCEIYISKYVKIDLSTINLGDELTITGIESKYKSYYEILPRGQEDIKKGIVASVPSAPQSLKAEITADMTVLLKWSAPASTGGSDITKYNVYKGDEAGKETLLTSVTNTQFEDKNVEEGKTYYYYVTAVNATGEGDKSDEVSVTVRLLLYPPTDLKAEVKDGKVELSWTAAKKGENSIAGYAIFRGTKSGAEPNVPLDIVDANTTTYTDSSVEAGNTYYYIVKAFDDQNPPDYSAPSNEVSVTIKQSDTIPPVVTVTAPTNFETVDEDTITVSGTVTDSGSGIDTVTVNGSAVTVASDGSFSVAVSLTEGENTIKIVATDKAGNKTTKTVVVTYKPQTVITLQPDNPYMTVNGVSQEIDPGRGTKPVIIPKWGRTVVPIRAIVEALGGTISWNGKERKVTINFNGTVIELWIDNPKAKVNGETQWIDPNNHDVKPIIINDRTMLPLRFVAENLGCKVDWDGTTRTITITYPAP